MTLEQKSVHIEEIRRMDKVYTMTDYSNIEFYSTTTYSLTENKEVYSSITAEYVGPKIFNHKASELSPIFVDKEFFSLLNKNSPFSAEYYSKPNPFSNHILEITKDSFDSFTKNSKSYECLLMSYSSHMIFRLDGTPVSVPVYIDYIGTPFTNKTLKLKEALNHVRNHPWTINGKDIEIQRIPYYNCEPDCNHCYSSFWVCPSQSEYEEICKIALAEKNKYPSCRVKDIIKHQHLVYGDREKYKDYMGLTPYLKPQVKGYSDEY